MDRMRNRSMAVLLALGVLAFLYCLVRLQLLTGPVGKSYPNYSSLRSDPLGSKALYDGLAESGAYKVSRELLQIRNGVVHDIASRVDAQASLS